MRLLTLNISSGIGFDPDKQLRVLSQALSDQTYDVVALQQVNQLTGNEEIPLSELDSYVPCQDRVPIKKGNFAFKLTELMKNSGQIWYWTWLPAHVGYERYDEGLAILTPHPIRKTTAFYLSDLTDYLNFKTRMAVGIQSAFGGELQWFFNVQFGWWNDTDEPFSAQWDRFMAKIAGIDAPVYVMGDFSAPDTVRGEAYDYIFEKSNFKDSFRLAGYKDDGITLTGTTDEWTDPQNRERMRADLILTNQDEKVLDSHVLFKGEKFQRISDHYGLSVEFGEATQNSSTIRENDLPKFASQKPQPMPLSVITLGGPLVVRTRNMRVSQSDPLAYLLDAYRRMERARGAVETIIFDEEE